MQMRQNSTLKWILHVTGKVKWLVGLLIVIQAILSLNSIMMAFILRRIINMAMAGEKKAFWNAIMLLAGILLLQLLMSALNRFVNE